MCNVFPTCFDALEPTSQASSEHSICVVVPEDQADKTTSALKAAFELELSRETVNSITSLKGMSVVAIIGEGMAFTPGVSATFTRALSGAGVNIRAIAQGSSERQVSAVVERNDVTRALRSVHGAFTLSGKVASVGIIGYNGNVGKQLIKQLVENDDSVFSATDIKTRVIMACDSTKMIHDDRGINLSNMDAVMDKAEAMDLEKVTALMEQDINPTRVILDLTDSEEVAAKYEEWLSKGIQVVTASKIVGAGPKERFDAVNKAASAAGTQWASECSVGAALPLINTVRDLRYTGDKVQKIEGVFSGTLTYLANAIEKGQSLADALKAAHEKGFTEPDPRNDLSGVDVARKLVILARELKMDVNVEDVEIEASLSPELAKWTAPKGKGELMPALYEQLKGGACKMLEEKIKAAAKNGKLIRQVGTIDVTSGKLSIELREVDASSRYGQLAESDNAICITSNRYSPNPLVVQGAGAGSVLTASGMFADLLRVCRAA